MLVSVGSDWVEGGSENIKPTMPSWKCGLIFRDVNVFRRTEVQHRTMYNVVGTVQKFPL